MRLLLVTSEPIAPNQLRDAVGDGLNPEEVEVMVVAPALQENALQFWLSDSDQAIAKAEEVRRRTARGLEKEGVPVSADTGESDPEKAIEDALRTFSADRIVLFVHPDQDQRYREDLDVGEVEQRFGVPVERVTVA